MKNHKKRSEAHTPNAFKSATVLNSKIGLERATLKQELKSKRASMQSSLMHESIEMKATTANVSSIDHNE